MRYIFNETYDPEHPLVIEAGGKLIEILNAMLNGSLEYAMELSPVLL
jgi:hypothetical protein